MSEQKDYKNIFKATGLFGGVQIISIVFSIIKTKIVAIWLGTTGFGIISIFNSTTTLISSLTNLGLQTSSVREIASAKDSDSLYEKISVTNKLAIATSVIGTLITIVISPLLSRWFFHNSDYIFPFILLSSVIFLTGLYNQCYAILQGLRKLTFLAVSSVLGAFFGLIISISLYYFIGEQGIVWSLVLTALITFIIGYIYVKKTSVLYYSIPVKNALKKGLPVLKLGIYIALSNNVAYLVQFLLKAYLSNVADVAEVGLFQAGWSLNTMYVGMVFTAMSKDYYPRLCQSANINSALSDKMNEQAEIGLLLLAPMVVLMMAFIDPVLNLLYSDEFLSVAPMTTMLLFGTLIQVASWSLGYVFLAKSDGKIYFINEVGTKVLMFPTYIIGYSIGQLEGLGVAFIVNQLIYIVWVGIVAKRRYSIMYSRKFLKLFAIIISVSTAHLLINRLFSEIVMWNWVFVIIISAYSLYQLNERIKILKTIKSRIKK
ncbi:MAG TPA: oligosaccharide flippase family protein [Macellibacteroides fermentans]|uniref:oligosaccharide flippase family protein n=1 Tax=Macellibacteroides fermentans TaxID=879969 RepID=UPI002BF5D4C2|nr:oligosaccharide flippase family protein [Macellibacteroides fermentans]